MLDFFPLFCCLSFVFDKRATDSNGFFISLCFFRFPLNDFKMLNFLFGWRTRDLWLVMETRTNNAINLQKFKALSLSLLCYARCWCCHTDFLFNFKLFIWSVNLHFSQPFLFLSVQCHLSALRFFFSQTQMKSIFFVLEQKLFIEIM